MRIDITESSIIRPAQDMPDQRLWVSNVDLIRIRFHLPTVYCYKPDDCSNFFEIKVLKEALSKVLVPFYPVAGRLGRDKNGRIEIDCNGEGVLFIEAETDSTTNDLGDFIPGMELQQLVPAVDYSCGISSYPLLVAQVTKFRCGGVSLGLGIHHTLADGASCLHFVNSWSNLARGLPITVSPFTDRTILRGRIPPNPKFHHTEYDPPPTMNSYNPKSELGNSMSNLKVTPHQLDTLKAKANNDKSLTKYSTYQILSAHIWRCACKARGLSDDQPTKLRIPVDGRSRFQQPQLPPGYFGNVIFLTGPIALSGELVSEPLVDTVKRIHKAINRMDDEYLRSSLDYLETVDDFTRLTPGPVGSSGPNIIVNSWIRLPFCKADFGWGSPLLFRPAKPFEGIGYIYSSPGNNGSLSLAICLETHAIKAFEKLFYDL